jgi:hypothetical protein
MEYILQENNQWAITYIDSTQQPQTLLIQAEIRNIPKYIETGVKEMLILDLEHIKEIVSSDQVAEDISNHMKLPDFKPDTSW